MRTYDEVVAKYLEFRNEIDRINNETKKLTAQLKANMAVCEAWLTEHAQEDGLTTIPTTHGTAYWSTHYSATVSSRDDFMNYVRENEAWDLLETRASKTAVKSLVEATGEPPPGVNFSSIRVLNIRAKD